MKEGSIAKGGEQICHAIYFIEHDGGKDRRAPYACASWMGVALRIL